MYGNVYKQNNRGRGGASLLACKCTCAFTSMRTGDDAFEEEKLEHLKFLLEYDLQVPLPPSKKDLNGHNFDVKKKLNSESKFLIPDKTFNK